uniref:Uncharacterized protein n=1 Tax=viral metagenome TaxID=1070528 RepID=A0A6H1ZJZ4_9ZZZZ
MRSSDKELKVALKVYNEGWLSKETFWKLFSNEGKVYYEKTFLSPAQKEKVIFPYFATSTFTDSGVSKDYPEPLSDGGLTMLQAISKKMEELYCNWQYISEKGKHMKPYGLLTYAGVYRTDGVGVIYRESK